MRSRPNSDGWNGRATPTNFARFSLSKIHIKEIKNELLLFSQQYFPKQPYFDQATSPKGMLKLIRLHEILSPW